MHLSWIATHKPHPIVQVIDRDEKYIGSIYVRGTSIRFRGEQYSAQKNDNFRKMDQRTIIKFFSFFACLQLCAFSFWYTPQIALTEYP
jgi:hypothetical protein